MHKLNSIYFMDEDVPMGHTSHSEVASHTTFKHAD